MRAIFNVMTDLGSVLLAFGLYFYFVHFPGHEPTSSAGFGGGLVIAFVLAIVYMVLELAPVLRDDTPSPLYLAWETMISYTPLFAFWVIGTLWAVGLIDISFFQGIVALIFLAVILLDVLGFLAIMTQRLFLTDEYKTTR